MITENKKWQAEEDARTLARADEIKSDADRLADAVIQSKRLGEEAAKEADRMDSISVLLGRKRKKPTQSYEALKKDIRGVRVLTKSKKKRTASESKPKPSGKRPVLSAKARKKRRAA